MTPVRHRPVSAVAPWSTVVGSCRLREHLASVVWRVLRPILAGKFFTRVLESQQIWMGKDESISLYQPVSITSSRTLMRHYITRFVSGMIVLAGDLPDSIGLESQYT